MPAQIVNLTEKAILTKTTQVNWNNLLQLFERLHCLWCSKLFFFERLENFFMLGGLFWKELFRMLGTFWNSLFEQF